MKRPILFTAFLSVALPAGPFVPSLAHAQVTTNEDALPEAAPAPPSSTRPAATPRTPPRHAAPSSGNAAHSARTPAARTPAGLHPAAASQRVGAAPEVPPHAPAPVVIPPPAVTVPTHPPVPPAEVKPVPDAKGTAMPHGSGLRLTFGEGSADLNPDMLKALQAEGEKLAAQPTLRITLISSASGSTEDLSTPRRISLARALNVRAVLIRAGIATTRIYPRATGLAPKDDTPADRVDLLAEGDAPVAPSQARFGTPSPEATR